MRNRIQERRADMMHYLRGILTVIFLVFVVLAAAYCFHFGRLVFTDDARTDAAGAVSYEITIQEGESTMTIGRELEKNGIIDSGLAFFVQTKLYSCKVPTGTYIISSNMSSKAIAKYFHQEYLSKKQEGTE